MKHMTRILLASVVLALPGVIPQYFTAYAAAPLQGAIFTTLVDGSIVNANTQYISKCAVYLDGGPGPNAPANAAGLRAGDYFFQVTDPSGQVLLSTDLVSNRRFRVSAAGVITAYTGTGGPPHLVGIDRDHPELGGITISLANTDCPNDFRDTPNQGGVYKVWVTPVESFVGDPTKVDNVCGNGCSHGFVSSTSKSDNFKVQATVPTFCLSVAKQIVDYSGGITPGLGWPILLTDPSGVTNNFFTNSRSGTLSICGLVAGSYTVVEDPRNMEVIGLVLDGTPLPAQPLYSFTWTPGLPAPSVVFQNRAFVPQ
jgi:hypothetical protein